MRNRLLQAPSIWIVAILLSNFLPCRSCWAAPGGRFAAQLDAECNALVRSAVRRPYGWAWGEMSGEDERRPAPKSVELEPTTTPAAALVLAWAGEDLQEPKYAEAARQAARGLVAAQDKNGRVPGRALFSAGNASREEAGVIADRSATSAALAVWLTLLEGGHGDEAFNRAASRAAHWLATQQSHAGAWMSAVAGDGSVGNPSRAVRLDMPDYRDSTGALLLAGEVLHDVTWGRQAGKALDQLDEMRIVDAARFGAGLWQANGPVDTVGDVPTAGPRDVNRPTKVVSLVAPVDLLASRFAMQTLMIGYLSTGDKALGMALGRAAQAAEALKGTDGQWSRRVDPFRGTAILTTRPATRPDGSLTEAALEEAFPRGTFGLPETLAMIKTLKLSGREEYVTLLRANFTLHQHMAQALVGLNDLPFTSDLPVTKGEVAGYLDRTAERWKILESAPPTDLPSRVERLFALLLRRRVDVRDHGAAGE